jgi:hypothetical protein
MRWRGGAEEGRRLQQAATRGDDAWWTAAGVRRFAERRSDLKFECVDLIGPETVGGWGGAEAQTHPWFCRQNVGGGFSLVNFVTTN